jgi:hypothetical protein
MRAEQVVKQMEPEILGCIARHLIQRHGVRGVGDVRLAHHVEHGLGRPGAGSPWLAWTGSPHPHIALPAAPGPEYGALRATQSA